MNVPLSCAFHRLSFMEFSFISHDNRIIYLVRMCKGDDALKNTTRCGDAIEEIFSAVRKCENAFYFAIFIMTWKRSVIKFFLSCFKFLQRRQMRVKEIVKNIQLEKVLQLFVGENFLLKNFRGRKKIIEELQMLKNPRVENF